jgi:hypothetical protein
MTTSDISFELDTPFQAEISMSFTLEESPRAGGAVEFDEEESGDGEELFSRLGEADDGKMTLVVEDDS